jgi:hypothetical protein
VPFPRKREDTHIARDEIWELIAHECIAILVGEECRERIERIGPTAAVRRLAVH